MAWSFSVPAQAVPERRQARHGASILQRDYGAVKWFRNQVKRRWYRKCIDHCSARDISVLQGHWPRKRGENTSDGNALLRRWRSTHASTIWVHEWVASPSRQYSRPHVSSRAQPAASGSGIRSPACCKCFVCARCGENRSTGARTGAVVNPAQ